jgi:hypothetical protein
MHKAEEQPKANGDKMAPSFDQWALVELFGHQQIVGRVTETNIAGGAFIRVDVPKLAGDDPSPAYTRFFNPSAVYSINPVEEQVARAMLTQARFRNEPVNAYSLPQLTDRPEVDSSHGGDDGV